MTPDMPQTPSLEGLQRQLIELQIKTLEKRVEENEQLQNERYTDHEKRLRSVEEIATRFSFLIYLTAGGGLIGLANLFAIMSK